MKLHYLASVQKLLENYDFQDKYKVMLDLEETLSNIEDDGHIDHETLLNTVGTPAQFVENIINKYNLSVVSNAPSASQASGGDTNVQQHTASETMSSSASNQVPNQACEQQRQYEDQRYDERQAQSHDQDRNNYNYDRHQRDDRSYNSNNNNTKEQEKNTKQKDSEGIATKTAKAPFKIFFSIITWIFFLLSLLVLSIGIVVSLIVLVLIDMQTSITLILGVLFFLIAILLVINFIKNIVFSIIERKANIAKLVTMFIFILVFAFLSKTMITSAINTVNLYISNNLYTVKMLFSSRSIDVSNIDWQHMDLGQYGRLIGNSIKSKF